VIATAARERNEIEAVARESAENKAPGTVVPVLADVTRASDCELVVDAAVTRFGRLDILVNNAGRGMKYVSDGTVSNLGAVGWFFSEWRSKVPYNQRHTCPPGMTAPTFDTVPDKTKSLVYRSDALLGYRGSAGRTGMGIRTGWLPCSRDQDQRARLAPVTD
jgi:hypothetical protein